MLYCICRYNNISDIDLCIQRTGYTCIDQLIHLIKVYKDLCTDSSVHFTDSALYNNCFFSIKLTFIKFHGCLFLHLAFCHILDQLTDFFFHRSDNSYHSFLISYLLYSLFLIALFSSLSCYIILSISSMIHSNDFQSQEKRPSCQNCYLYRYCLHYLCPAI